MCIEEEIDRGDLAALDDHEIGSGISRRFARTARHPPDSPPTADLFGRGSTLALPNLVEPMGRDPLRSAPSSTQLQSRAVPNVLLERHLAGAVATGEAARRDFAKRRRLGAAAGDGVAAAWMEVAA